MTNRTARHPDEDDMGDGTVTPQRAIPDGGLGAAMPEWLQQTPSWKRSPEPTPVRSIPAPDTSVIDPRHLIDVDDLPQWLQAVSSREPGKRTSTVALIDPETSLTIAPEIPEIMPLTVPQEETRLKRLALPSDSWPPMRDVGRPAERSEPVRLVPSPSAARPPWWMSDAALAILFVAIVLTMIYVILVASGVI